MKPFHQGNDDVDSFWRHAGEAPLTHDELSNRPRVSYQASLRTVGAYLDKQQAARINVLEANDGYVVRYQPQADMPDAVMTRLSFDDLLSITQELEAKRRRRTFSFHHRSEPVRTYENILRALGYELDAIDAYSLLIDEVDEGMLVTYQYFKPSEGFNARKRMVILGTDAVEQVLHDAEARRERRRHGVLTLLAG